MNEINVNFERMLRDGRLAVPPLEVRVLAGQGVPLGVDAIIEVVRQGRTYRFVAELKRDAKPLTLKLAIEQVRQAARESGQGRPMIVAPYFSREKLDQLIAAGISAIDFSGNAAIDVPGEFFFYKTGNPNLYPDSAPIRSAYQGDGSLVARVLLLERQFQTVGDVLASIKRRGGSLTMGTVSKALQRLESDLAIERPSRSIVRVLQPTVLLDGLLGAYQPPKVQGVWTGKVALPAPELLARLQGIASDGGLVRTGESSAGQYAVWAGEPIVACYCRETPTALLNRLGAEANETLAFPNLRLIQTEDQRVYFDARPNLIASPIQAWLEMASGDKRQKEVAEQIRNGIVIETKGAA